MNYRLAVRSCYLGAFVQAIVINLSPVLFIPIKDQFGLSFEQIGRLVLINFSTQLILDIALCGLISRWGAKRFAILANSLIFVGLWIFALLPSKMNNPYLGLVIGTVCFSIGAGILELGLSPIINAVPSDQKAQDMALCHAFYAWGQMTVILLTALAVYLLGPRYWPLIVLVWSIFPLTDAAAFYMAKVPPFVEESKRQRVRDLVRKPWFIGAAIAIGLAGASELSIAQWMSTFAEKGLGFPKIYGDLGGVCLFAAAMGAGRTWYGLRGEQISVGRVLTIGAGLSVVAYLAAALSPWPYMSLGACIIAGLGVSLLWPGMLSMAADKFPLAGASMFAIMAAAGDTGGSVAPWLVGLIADKAPSYAGHVSRLFGGSSAIEQIGLRTGLLSATLYPLAMLFLLCWLRSKKKA